MDKFNWTQFRSLPRYENGRIIGLSDVFLSLTPQMVLCLHSDDWSYYQELQEELECMMAELNG